MTQARENRTPLVAAGQIEHHAADLTATVAADVTLAEVQRTLFAAGQWLPIDGEPSRTVGELVDRNSSGPLRLGYGAWRDLLLGAQFTNGAAELITAGGRAVKNVAGYDLTKFMVGQHGVFGRLVTITTRTYKRPDAALLATFEPEVRMLNKLLVMSCRPQWVTVDREALRCGFLGDERTVAFYETAIARHGPKSVRRMSMDDDVVMRNQLWRPSRETSSFRASVPPTRLRCFADHAHLRDGWIADAAFGVVLGDCEPPERDNIESAARAAGGSVMFFDADGRPTNLHVDVGIARLLGRLKNSFDPDHRLAPLPLPSPRALSS